MGLCGRDQAHRGVDSPVVGDSDQTDPQFVALVQERGVVLAFVVVEGLRSVAALVGERVDLQRGPNSNVLRCSIDRSSETHFAARKLSSGTWKESIGDN